MFSPKHFVGAFLLVLVAVSCTEAQGRGRGGRLRDQDKNTNNANTNSDSNNNGNSNAAKVDKQRSCAGVSGDDLTKCKRETECQGVAKRERQQCRRELRCAALTAEAERASCMQEESCADFDTEDLQNRCRANKLCGTFTGKRRNDCVQANNVKCNDKASEDERTTCKAERICAYVKTTDEKRKCVRASVNRCRHAPEGVERDACLAERKVQKASKEAVAELNNRLNRRAARYRILANQRRGPPTYRPEVARSIPGIKKQVNELTINEQAGEDLFGGDMALSQTQLDDMQTMLDVAGDVPIDTGRRRKRKVGQRPTYWLWDTLPISYKFDTYFPQSARLIVRDAIQQWESETCVRWVENGNSPDKIQFYSGGGCSSYVGRTGGMQEISIAVPGCDYVGIVQHEIGHSLGFIHEQARPDQSAYLNIVYDNISPFRWNNFLPSSATEVSDYSYKYDYGSVMHYNAYSFALDKGRIALETSDPYYQQTIGQRNGPSFIDIAQVNAAYCANKCPSKLACQHGGYTDPNSCARCKCPSGFGGTLCERQQIGTCGGMITATPYEQFIQSPGHPGLFPKSTECAWLIQSEPGTKVELEFVAPVFEFECKESCDENHVEVKLGDDWTRTGYRFCCNVRPTNTFISQDNKMVVIFRAYADSTAHRGFKARIKSDGQTTTSSSSSSTTTTLPTTTPTTTTTTTTRATTTTRPSTTTTPSTTRSTSTSTSTSTSRPMTTTQATTTYSYSPPTTATNKPGCTCSQWGAWQGACTQTCGGCGTRTRKRTCNERTCYDSEKQKCNFAPCVGQNWLWNNFEFHLLFQGCCIGQFKGADGQCKGSLTEMFGTWLPAFDTVKLPMADNPFGK